MPNDSITKIINRGVARTNRYQISIPTQDLQNLPYFSKLGINAVDPMLSIRCHIAELPGMNFAASEIRHYGPLIKHPYATDYPELGISFLLSEHMFEKLFIEAWMYSINDPLTHDTFYYNDFTKDISIDLLNEKGETTYSCTLLNAYPLGMEEVNLSFDDKNTAASMSVKFAYKKWINSSILTFSSTGSIHTDVTPFTQTIQPVTNN